MTTAATRAVPRGAVPATGRDRIRFHGPPIAGICLVTAVFYWPVLAHFGSRFMVDPGDGAILVWGFWHFGRALERLSDPFTTHLMFHPVGADLTFHAFSPLQALVVWPLSKALGLTLAVNVVNLAAVPLAGIGAYFLAYRYCRSRFPAFLAGVAFAFLPYRAIRAFAHLNLNHTEVLPFGLLALLRLYDRPARRRAWALGVMAAVAMLVDFNYLLLLGLASLVVVVSRRRESWARPLRGCWAHAGVAMVVVALPYLLAIGRALANGEYDPLPRWGGADILSADLLSWLVPPNYHPVLGPHLGWLGTVNYGGESIAYPGLTILLLAAAGIPFARRKRQTFWIAIFAIFFVLSLGPYLHVGGATGHLFSHDGHRFTVPLPYLGLRLVPFFASARAPGRFGVMGALALDVLAAGGLTYLSARIAQVRARHGVDRAQRERPGAPSADGQASGSHPLHPAAGAKRRTRQRSEQGRPNVGRVLRETLGRHRAGLPLLALAVLLFELLPPRLPALRPEVPQPYARIARDPDPAAVLEIPLWWSSNGGYTNIGDQTNNDTVFLYYATAHGKPVVSGTIARYPAKRIAMLTSLPAYRQILTLEEDPSFHDEALFTACDLRRLGIAFVVYHRDRPMPRAFDYLSALRMPVVADDGVVVVWKVPGAPPSTACASG